MSNSVEIGMPGLNNRLPPPQPSQPPVPPSNPPSGPAPLYINIIVKEEKKEEEDLIMASVSYLLLLNVEKINPAESLRRRS